MSKIPFSNVSPIGFENRGDINPPLLLPDLRSEKSSHVDLVARLNQKFIHPQTLIDEGANGFKAWREELGIEDYDIANALGVDCETYKLIEKGLENVGSWDVLNASKFFGVLPYQLYPENKPMSPELLKAMLIAVNDITFSKDKHFKIKSRLVDEAKSAHSFEKLRSRAIGDKADIKFAIVKQLADLLLTYDGSKAGRDINLNEFFKSIEESLNEREEKLREAKEREDGKRRATWDQVNRLAWKLYDQQGSSWQTIWFGLKIFEKAKGREEMLNHYEHHASSIGRQPGDWPKSPIDFTTEDKRYIGGWQSGHRYHAALLRKYYKEYDIFDKANDNINQFVRQRMLFDTWLKSNRDVIGYFLNRQKIMHAKGFERLYSRQIKPYGIG